MMLHGRQHIKKHNSILIAAYQERSQLHDIEIATDERGGGSTRAYLTRAYQPGAAAGVRFLFNLFYTRVQLGCAYKAIYQTGGRGDWQQELLCEGKVGITIP